MLLLHHIQAADECVDRTGQIRLSDRAFKLLEEIIFDHKVQEAFMECLKEPFPTFEPRVERAHRGF